MALFKMTSTEASRWSESRQRGPFRFVVAHGLVWGALLFAFHAIWDYLDGSLAVGWLWLRAVVSPLVGIVLYAVLWRINERLFRDRVRADEPSARAE